MKLQKFYKLARPDGWDFYTGNTINYRDGIGGTVYAPRYDPAGKLCSNAFLHASRKPDQCFVGAEIPCSAFIVYGTPILEDEEKAGFGFLKIEQEVEPDKLFKWNYQLAANPVMPFNINPPKIINPSTEILKVWASVWDSVRASVWASVWDSVWDSVRASVWDSVGASVWDSVGASVGASVGDSVREIFLPVVKKWKYIDHKKGVYPFQPACDLFRLGLVPSFDGKLWRLHSKNGIEWEGEL